MKSTNREPASNRLDTCVPEVSEPDRVPRFFDLLIPDKASLYKHYMPFILGGGLFIPTRARYRLNQEVFVLLRLSGNSERLAAIARIVWITPTGAQNQRQAGIGLQFLDAGSQMKSRIENFLAGDLDSNSPTLTL